MAAVTTVTQGPPTVFDDKFTIDGNCAFVELQGRSKTIEFGGRAIFTSPRLTATLTNLHHPATHETFNVSWVFHQTIFPNVIGTDAEDVRHIHREVPVVLAGDGNLVETLSARRLLIDVREVLE